MNPETSEQMRRIAVEASEARRAELVIAAENRKQYGTFLGRCGHLGWYPGCPNCAQGRAT